MTTLHETAVLAKAEELAASGPAPAGAVDELIEAAGGDLTVLEGARDAAAARVHAAIDDFEATAMLGLLNRALSKAPRHDPLDWKVRWGQRFRRP